MKSAVAPLALSCHHSAGREPRLSVVFSVVIGYHMHDVGRITTDQREYPGTYRAARWLPV